MPPRRRNWQQANSTEWVKILRGRRSLSVQWPSAKGQEAKKSMRGAQSPQGPTSPIKVHSPSPFPEEVMFAAQAAVVSFGTLDDADVVVKQALQSALERARARVTERPLKERIKEAEVFVGRAGKRLANDSSIVQAVEALKEVRGSSSRRARSWPDLFGDVAHKEQSEFQFDTMFTFRRSAKPWSSDHQPATGGQPNAGRARRVRGEVAAAKWLLNHWGRSPGCGKISWSVEELVHGCTFPNRT